MTNLCEGNVEERANWFRTGKICQWFQLTSPMRPLLHRFSLGALTNYF